MSSHVMAVKKYECLNDCRMEGCPGHELTIINHGTSDTTAILVDGENHATFDDNLFDAIIDAMNESYARSQAELAKRIDGVVAQGIK